MIKDALYKSYLSNEIDEYALIQKMDELQIKDIKKAGVIYTPRYIVDYMISISSINPQMKLVEPTCGHGVFVFSVLEYMQTRYQLTGQSLLDWFIHHFICIDISDNTILELKEMLTGYFLKHFQLQCEVDIFSNVVCEDSLFGIAREYDLAIGNPPYVRVHNIDPQYLINIRNSFKTCKKGNIDLYYAFVEKYSNCSKRVCFITPNSFLTNISAQPIYAEIMSKVSLIVDFKAQLIFKDARTYTAIFKLDTESAEEYYQYSDNINGPFITKERVIKHYKKVEKNNVLTGIASLADRTYLVKLKNGRYYAHHEGIDYEVEKGLLTPYFKVTKIKDNKFEYDYMIFPYDQQFKIVPENIIIEQYPMTYQFLLAIKQRLSERDCGKTQKYESWYAYGRKQGFYTIAQKEVAIVPIMIGEGCVPQKINIESEIKEFGRILFTSGFIITEDFSSLFEPAFMEYVVSEGKPWPGKTVPYYAVTSKQVRQYLQNIKIN